MLEEKKINGTTLWPKYGCLDKWGVLFILFFYLIIITIQYTEKATDEIIHLDLRIVLINVRGICFYDL